MMKCSRKQASDPQNLKNCQRSFSRFLFEEAKTVEVEVLGVEAVEK